LIGLKKKKPYDIIFIDPPYNQKLVDQTLFLLEQKQWVRKKSLIYIEKENTNSFFISKNWTLYKKKTTNRIACYLYFFKI
jgi:16S rRNA (guanine966-N2)-methyltransferase